jgi:hypothetical protein
MKFTIISILTLAAGSLFCQPFSTSPIVNPFGIGQGQSHYRLAFDDLDGDGDFDILTLDQFGNNAPFVFWQNVGTMAAPTFVKSANLNPFGLQPVNFMNNFFLIDWDNDGDKDLFGGGNNGFFYYNNTGSAGQPNFEAPVTNPFGLTAPSGSNTLIPTIGDVDGDGLLDLLVGDYNARLFFYKNVGALGSPMFSAPQISPFGYVKPAGNPVFLAPVLQDVNEDGLLDLLVGFNPGKIVLYSNSGTATAPVFASSISNPLGLSLSNFNTWAMPIFYDMDSDGDDDLIVTSFSNLRYYENLRMVNKIDDLYESSYFKIMPNPAQDYFWIDFDTALLQQCTENKIRARLINMSGQISNINFTISSGRFHFPAESIAPGSYIVEILICNVPHHGILQKI